MPEQTPDFRTGVAGTGIQPVPLFRCTSILTALFISTLLLAQSAFAAAGAYGFAVATSYVPVFNNAGIHETFGGHDGNSLALDECGRIRSLEFIALPGTAFRIEAVVEHPAYPVYRVTTKDYPYRSQEGLYIDGRLVERAGTEPQPRSPKLPSRTTVLDSLVSAKGSPYAWGGNRRAGIPAMLELYPVPPGSGLSRASLDRWALRGLDCSGLLYEATDGFTPRNTSSLVRYGTPVPVAGLDADGIASRIEPLDLIVWNGHVMIALDGEQVIESRLGCSGGKNGVVIRGLREALREVLTHRVPLDDYVDDGENSAQGFVVRRWYPEGTGR
jgi:hypothetical protein